MMVGGGKYISLKEKTKMLKIKQCIEYLNYEKQLVGYFGFNSPVYNLFIFLRYLKCYAKRNLMKECYNV